MAVKIAINPYKSFQSTLSQGERHASLDDLVTALHISIHALARRATTVFKQLSIKIVISIHALARRATLILTIYHWMSVNFNPRSRKESDIIRIIIRRNRLPFQSTLSQGERLLPRLTSPPFAIISIHALARRATRPGGQSACTIRHFNPRSRKESDLSAVIIRLLSPAFQSTLSQGERRRVHKDAFQRFIFQSTLSQGERPCAIVVYMVTNTNFNPRSRKESDHPSHTRYDAFYHFNPRSRKESDGTAKAQADIDKAFQSTLSQGERRRVHKDAFQKFIFQSTLSQGERLYELAQRILGNAISIHALARRATIFFLCPVLLAVISIHALARRATHKSKFEDLTLVISIHALARRATYWKVYNDWFRDISIHALARRATFLYNSF